jgi:hypothetical protein
MSGLFAPLIHISFFILLYLVSPSSFKVLPNLAVAARFIR